MMLLRPLTLAITEGLEMTIAACHVSPEGVVLGADSTTTIVNHDTGIKCHFDNAQKLFEIGKKGATLGLVTWGLGQIGNQSHRTIAARLGQEHEARPSESVEELATRLADMTQKMFMSAYREDIERTQSLHERFLEDPKKLSEQEHQELYELFSLRSGGYCLAGRIQDAIACEAYSIEWSPILKRPKVEKVPEETPRFWGQAFIIERLLFGFDAQALAQILNSGKWSGTNKELFDLVSANQLIHPKNLPIREAIDWIHTILHTTIRGVKFAQESHVCGGPIEIAAITTDRPFRWVCHKRMDAAIVTAQESIVWRGQI